MQDMAAPQIIKAPTWGGNDISLVKMGLVWLMSLVMNLIIIGGFGTLFYFIDKATASPREEKQEIKTRNEVEDAPVEKDLTATDIGLDPTKDLNYFVDRIENV